MFVIPAISIIFLVVSVILDFVLNRSNKQGENTMKKVEGYKVQRDGTVTKEKFSIAMFNEDQDGDEKVKMFFYPEVYEKLIRSEIQYLGLSKKEQKLVDTQLIIRLIESTNMFNQPIDQGKHTEKRMSF